MSILISRLGAVVALAAVSLATSRQTRGTTAPIVRDDTAAVARYLNAVRGADPLLCELAVRHVDNQNHWSNWYSSTGNPLDLDSASTALLRWVQHAHNDPAVVPRLRGALRDPDACVRRVAGGLLGRVEHPSAVAALVAALDDPSAGTRYVAAIGLGLAEKPDRSTEPLIRRLRDESPLVRRAAAWAVGAMESREAMVPLIELLQRDSDPRVRQAAAWSIGQISK